MMKKRIFALFVCLCMMLGPFGLLLPVAAETTELFRIGGKTFENLKAAIDAADNGDTIELLGDFTYDIASNDKGECNVFIDKTLTISAQTPVTMTIKNGGLIIGNGAKANVTVRNLNVKQIAPQTGNVQALVGIRNGSAIDLENCSFESNGTRGGINGFIMASSNGGSVNLKECTFGLTNKTDASPLFSVYTNGNHFLKISMTDCTVTSESKATRGFALCSAMTVNLNGSNTFHTDGEILSSNDGTGGIVYVNGPLAVDENAVLLGENVKAATVIVTDNAMFGSFARPVVNEEAELRVNGNSYGLRFTSTVAAAPDGFTPAYGTVIAKKSTFEGTLSPTDWYNATNMTGHAQMLTIRASEGKTTDADGVTTIRAAMVKIKEANYGEVFAARAYAQYTNDATETKIIVFSVMDIEKQCASFKNVIEKAMAVNVKDESAEGFSNAVENGTKYTCYTADQYAELKAIAQS